MSGPLTARVILSVKPHHQVSLPGGRAKMAALMKVAGLTVFERAVRTSKRAGFDEVCVVVEGARREIRELIRRKRLPVRDCPQPQAAGPKDSPSLTVPSNCIFDQNALQQLCQRGVERLAPQTPESEELFIYEITTPRDARRAESALYRHRSGKNTDGFHTRLMKRFTVRPLTWFFLRTPLTPNMISILGLCVALGSGILLARGGYWHTLLGAMVFYLASALDHCDGAVARLKFQESAFGCWLESICDYVSYLSLYAGLTLGLYQHSRNVLDLYLGLALALGAVLTFGTASVQRRKRFREDPAQFHSSITSKLGEKASHPWYAIAKHCSFLTRRSAVALYLLLFALLDLGGAFLFLSALALNLIWIAVLSAVRLLPSQKAPAA